MSEVYTSGTWMVKAGEEDAFVAAWTAFVTWASELPGSGTFRLVRDTGDPSHYMSFAPWESIEAQQAWRDLPEFPERIGRVRAHCDEAHSSTFEVVTIVG